MSAPGSEHPLFYFESEKDKLLWNSCIGFIKYCKEHNQKPIKPIQPHVCEGGCTIIESSKGSLFFCLQTGNVHECTMQTCSLTQEYEEGGERSCPFSGRIYQTYSQLSAHPSMLDMDGMSRELNSKQKKKGLTMMMSDSDLDALMDGEETTTTLLSSQPQPTTTQRKVHHIALFNRQKEIQAYIKGDQRMRAFKPTEKNLMNKQFGISDSITSSSSLKRRSIHNYEEIANAAFKEVWERLTTVFHSKSSRILRPSSSSSSYSNESKKEEEEEKEKAEELKIREKVREYCIHVWEMVVLSPDFIKQPNVFRADFICLIVIYEFFGKGREEGVFPIIQKEESISKYIPDIRYISKLGFHHANYTRANKQIQLICNWWITEPCSLITDFHKLPQLVQTHFKTKTQYDSFVSSISKSHPFKTASIVVPSLQDSSSIHKEQLKSKYPSLSSFIQDS